MGLVYGQYGPMELIYCKIISMVAFLTKRQSAIKAPALLVQQPFWQVANPQGNPIKPKTPVRISPGAILHAPWKQRVQQHWLTPCSPTLFWTPVGVVPVSRGKTIVLLRKSFFVSVNGQRVKRANHSNQGSNFCYSQKSIANSQ